MKLTLEFLESLTLATLKVLRDELANDLHTAPAGCSLTIMAVKHYVNALIEERS